MSPYDEGTPYPGVPSFFLRIPIIMNADYCAVTTFIATSYNISMG